MGSLVFGDGVIVSERRESVRGRSRGVFMSISSHLRLYIKDGHSQCGVNLVGSFDIGLPNGGTKTVYSTSTTSTVATETV